MSVDILATLTPDELDKFRRVEALHHGIQVQVGSADPFTPQQARDFYIQYWQYVGGLLHKYEIEMDEREACRISPYTGQIYLGGE